MTLYMKEQEIREEVREEVQKKVQEEVRKETIKILVETTKSLHIPTRAVSEQLMERFGLTKEEADSYMNQE